MDRESRMRVAAPLSRYHSIPTALRPAPQVTDLVARWSAHGERVRQLAADLDAVSAVAARRNISPSDQLSQSRGEVDVVDEIAALARRALTIDAWMDQFSRMPPAHVPSRRLMPRLKLTKRSDVEPMLHPDDIDNRKRALQSIVASVDLLRPSAEQQLAGERSKLLARFKRAGSKIDHDPLWFHLGNATVDGIDIHVGWCPNDGPLVLASSDRDRGNAQRIVAHLEATNATRSSTTEAAFEILRIEPTEGPDEVDSLLTTLVAARQATSTAMVIDASDVVWTHSVFLRTHPSVLDCSALRTRVGARDVDVVLDCQLGERGVVDA